MMIVCIVLFWLACDYLGHRNLMAARDEVIQGIKNQAAIDAGLVKNSYAFSYVFPMIPHILVASILILSQDKGFLEYAFLAYLAWRVGSKGLFLIKVIELSKEQIVAALMEAHKK